MAVATTPLMPLTAEEAAERRRAIDSALGSMRIENMEPDVKVREIAERYVRGEIDLATMQAEMDECTDAA